MLGKLFAHVRQQWIGALVALCLVLIGGIAFELAGNDSVDSVWIGVVGTALGGLIGFMTTWVVHQSERAERIDARAERIEERLRAEKKEAYAAFLTKSEDSVHLFERIVKGDVSPADATRDKVSANNFFDDNVMPRYRVLKIIVDDDAVVSAAKAYRNSLNDVRHLWAAGKKPPDRPTFHEAHEEYRAARDEFTDRARADLAQRTKTKTGEAPRNGGARPGGASATSPS